MWDGDAVVAVIPREVKGGRLESWVARCNIGEGAAKVVFLSLGQLMGFLTIPSCPSVSSLRQGQLCATNSS